MQWRRGFLRIWIVLSVIWLAGSVWHLNPVSRLTMANCPIVLTGLDHSLEFPPGLPLAEIRKAVTDHAETRVAEIKRKIARGESLTPSEFLDDGLPPETIADRILTTYEPRKETALAIWQSIAMLALLPPLALLATGWIIGWIIAGFAARDRLAYDIDRTLTNDASWGRTSMNEQIPIQGRDFWVKVVEMLQQNWALIEHEASERVRVYFIGDTSGIFDELEFSTSDAAIAALRRNGFRRFADDKGLQSFLSPPSAPFHRQPHPSGPIYSSGRFWKG